jgi:hypothetical protein
MQHTRKDWSAQRIRAFEQAEAAAGRKPLLGGWRSRLSTSP